MEHETPFDHAVALQRYDYVKARELSVRRTGKARGITLPSFVLERAGLDIGDSISVYLSEINPQLVVLELGGQSNERKAKR